MTCDVLNFGSLNLDRIFKVDHLVRAGETLSCTGSEAVPGGKGLNQSVALSRAGLKVAHAGKIGRGGDVLRQYLQKNGVNVELVVQDESLPGGEAFIQVDSEGRNSIVLEPGANFEITPAEIEAVVTEIPRDGWLLLQNEINSIPEIMRAAAGRGARIAINPAPCRENVRNYPLELAEFIFVNEIEAFVLTGCADPETAAQCLAERYPHVGIIVTLGSAGALFKRGRERIFQPAQKVKVVDTTGAGDTFTGYFLAGIHRKLTVEGAMKVAARAADLAVSEAGAANSIPTADRVFRK